jgi:DNA repair protein RadC
MPCTPWPSCSGYAGFARTRRCGWRRKPFSYPLPNRLMAARELLRRALAETLADTSVSLASPGAVRDYLRLFLAGQAYESFLALWLDAQNRLIAGMELFRGTTTQTSVYPREVVRAGLKLNASAVILAHNHPSGLAEPSRADELLTSELKQALALVDIRVLDHFIVADTTVHVLRRKRTDLIATKNTRFGGYFFAGAA